ncbi:MAG TPA: recombinase family protein [Longimicrobium sp.]|nr:recombinase family protein [Longimicrobium sp.]
MDSYLRPAFEDTQRAAVADYLNGGRWTLVGEFEEVESGKNIDRPALKAALAACRIHGATLVVAKLDRLSRNAAFLMNLRDVGVDFVAVDMPGANRLTVDIMAVFAEDEARRISTRTRECLAAAKAKGVKLGNPANLSDEDRRAGSKLAVQARKAKAAARTADLAPILAEIQASGATSLRQIAAALNARQIPTARGGEWTAMQVSRVLPSAP